MGRVLGKPAAPAEIEEGFLWGTIGWLLLAIVFLLLLLLPLPLHVDHHEF